MWVAFSYTLTAIGGFVLGLIVEFGYLHYRGHKIVTPYIAATSRNFTIAAIFLAMISLLTIVNVERNAYKSEECDQQFRRALAYNTSLNNEQREINNRATGISAQRRTLMDGMFVQIGNAISNGRSGDIKTIVQNYNLQVKPLADEYDRLIAERKVLESNRKPYPEPKCGSTPVSGEAD